MSNGTILIVDDIPTNLEVLSNVLENVGYKVLVALDGESAIEQIDYARPDIILLDVMMPGIDGFETCRRLKVNPQTEAIPVIFMTALSDVVDKVRGFEVGAADYITKPLQHEEVVARVGAHLTLYRQKQEIADLREQDRTYYEKLSALKDDLLSTASHDLKNPLAGMMSAIYLLRKHLAGDEKALSYLTHLQEDADRMYDLIHDLLDLARLETGLALTREHVPLYDFLAANLQDFANAARNAGIELALDVPNEGISLLCDPRRLSQALHNLLSNALKYTPQGGKVILCARVEDAEIFIRVQDNGLGIPPEALPHLFDKFYRVSTNQHMAAAGTGLGLSIVKTIVEQHGGQIWVDSKLGKGSTFSLIFPT